MLVRCNGGHGSAPIFVTVTVECSLKYLRVHRKDISFLRFIFEASSGIATLRTVDAGTGSVVLHIPPGREQEVAQVLADLGRTMLIEQSDENGNSVYSYHRMSDERV